MPEINKHEIRSAEMQEVMSGIPGSFLRWGLFIFFGIILILICGSYFIRNPEIVTVPVVLTTQNPPVALVAKSGGEIKKLFVAEGSVIVKEEVIALISNTGDYSDVNKLNLFLSSFNDNSDWIEIVRSQRPPPEFTLGEIQGNYTIFQKQWKQMKDYLDQAYLPAKLKLLEEQIEKKAEYNNELLKQKKLITEDLELSKRSYDRDSMLYYKSDYSISVNEFERSKQGYIQKLYSFSVFNASLKNNEADFLRLKENRMDLQVQYEKELNQYIFTMEESLQLLQSSISLWEEKYVVKSPVAGKVTFTRFRNENQVINVGEALATVIPDTIMGIVVQAVIPISGFGKIDIGQEVNIKLSGFPYMQYGVLKGQIYSVSQVPGEQGFIAEIELTEGMTSTYREKIKFIHEMNGTADIITEESRLIYKFIDPLRTLFAK